MSNRPAHVELLDDEELLVRLHHILEARDAPQRCFQSHIPLLLGEAAHLLNTVVQHNGIPALVALMGSPELDVCEQAVWAIGNIAGDCPALRDLVLARL